jgi:hypothetical protein
LPGSVRKSKSAFPAMSKALPLLPPRRVPRSGRSRFILSGREKSVTNHLPKASWTGVSDDCQAVSPNLGLLTSAISKPLPLLPPGGVSTPGRSRFILSGKEKSVTNHLPKASWTGVSDDCQAVSPNLGLLSSAIGKAVLGYHRAVHQ